MALPGIDVDVPTAIGGMVIFDEVEIAVDLVDCLNELGSDCFGLVQGQGRGQQFHACQAVFRPVQRVQPIFRDDIKAGLLGGSGWSGPGAACPVPQFGRECSAEGRRSLVHGLSFA